MAAAPPIALTQGAERDPIIPPFKFLESEAFTGTIVVGDVNTI